MGFWRSQEVASKKERSCQYCGKKISIGEKYSREAGTYKDEFINYPLCMFCKTAHPILSDEQQGDILTGQMVEDLINQGYLSCQNCKSVRVDYKRTDPDKHKFMCNCKKCNYIWMVELTTDIFYKNQGGK